MQEILHYLHIFSISLLQAFLSTTVSVIISLPIAHILMHSHKTVQTIWIVYGLFCVVLPTQVCAVSVLYAIGLQGLPAIIITHAIMNIPLFVYVLLLAYKNIDMHTVWIARASGARNLQVYRDGIWPIINPTLFCTSAIVFIYCFSSFWPPMILGVSEYHYTTDIFLYHAYQEQNWPQGVFFFLARISTVLCTLGYCLDNAQKAYFSSDIISYISRARYSSIYSVLSVCALIALMYPFICFAMQASVAQLLTFFTTYQWYTVTLHSIVIALISSAGSIVVGLLCVYGVVSYVHKRQQQFMQFVTLFPLLFSSIGTAFVFKYIAGVLQGYTYCMIAVTHVLLNYVFVYRMVYDYWQLFPQQLLDLARSAGATHVQILCTVIIPYLRPVIIASWAFACALSLVESGGASLVITDTPFTLSLALKECIAQNDMSGIVGLSVVLVSLVSGIVGGIELFKSKRT